MILVLNFKTYLKKVKDYLNLIKKLPKTSRHQIWLAINPYFYFPIIKKLKRKDIKIGLQNLGFVSQKPQTGEIIYDFELINKAYFVLLGHSERYKFGENIKIVQEKIKTLQNKNLKLLIFFSENSHKPKEKFSRAKRQTQKNLESIISIINPRNYKKIYFVYEPWWAISTEKGKIPPKEFLEDFLAWYRKKYNFPILYGGSFNSKLVSIYKDLNFDGFVLGKASTSPKEIIKILESI
jgi:triosephosphate isomerase